MPCSLFGIPSSPICCCNSLDPGRIQSVDICDEGSMELRCTKMSDSILQSVGYRRGQADRKWVALAKSIANREALLMWVLFCLTLLLGVAFIVFALIIHPQDFLRTVVIGREGGASFLWLLLIALAAGAGYFQLMIWGSKVRMRCICTEMNENLPYCTQVPVKVAVLEEKDLTKFRFVAAVDVVGADSRTVTDSWFIMNTGRSFNRRCHDREDESWLEKKAAESEKHEGALLVDQEGEPYALLVEEKVLWLLSNRFLKAIELPPEPAYREKADEAKTRLRHIIRTAQHGGLI